MPGARIQLWQTNPTVQTIVGSPKSRARRVRSFQIAPRAYCLRHRNTPKVFPVTPEFWRTLGISGHLTPIYARRRA